MEVATQVTEYLADPQFNPGADRKPDKGPEPKVLTEMEKALAKLFRQLQESDLEQLEMVQRVLKATKMAPLFKPSVSAKAGAEVYQPFSPNGIGVEAALKQLPSGTMMHGEFWE